MRCLTCHSDNSDDRRFCAQCGAGLPLLCADCGFSNEGNARFCGGCGRALSRGEPPCIGQQNTAGGGSPAPVSSPPEAERRQLTVMFCDLVASTSLGEQLDPEDLRDIIHDYQNAVASVVFRYEGFIAKYMGDGILIYFGYPVAHEDDPERALRAGLEIVNAVNAVEHPSLGSLEQQLAVRVGVATGLVVVGDLLGHGASEEQAVIGSTPNLAARLQDIASPDTVIAAQGTARLVRGRFVMQDLDSHRLKGIAEPVHCYQVVATRQRGSRFETVQGDHKLPPMVGRDAEMETLQSAWQQACDGHGQALLIRGEAGLGKSRLLRKLRDQVVGDQHPLLLFQCSPFYAHTAFFPFIAQIRFEAVIAQEDSNTEALCKLRNLIYEFFADPERDLPLVAALLSLQTDCQNLLTDLTPERRKILTSETLLNHAINIARRSPLLVVVEDLHWSDPSTRDLLKALIRQLHGLPMLLLISSREKFPKDWLISEEIDEIVLGHLDEARTREVIERITAGKALPAEVVQQIIDKTDGVPLYVEELTKTVIGSDLLEEKDDCYLLTGPLRALSIPATLQDSLLARLARLSPIKEVAQNAAVIGREFNVDLLSAISPLGEASLDGALEQLEQAEIISQLSQPPNAHYLFRHALVQDAAYESLLLRQRQRLHGDIANAVLERFPERARTEPELIAHHFTEAQQMEQAVSHWARAGHNALAASANVEAIAQLGKALSCLQRLPADGERDSREIELRIALGAACRATQGFSSEQAEQNFSRALALGEQSGQSGQTVDALRGLYAYHYINGQLSTALVEARHMLKMGRGDNSTKLRMLGHWMVGGVHFWQGEFVQAQQHLEQSSALYNPADHPGGTLADQVDPGVNALLHMGWNLWFLGRPDEAERVGDKGIAMARTLKQPFATAMALHWAASARLCNGDTGSAGTMLRELKEIAGEHQYAYLNSCAKILESQLALVSGELEQGQRRLFQALSEFASQGAGIGLPWVLIFPIAANLAAGQLDVARGLLAQALDAVARNGEHQWQAELLRLSAELALLEAGDDYQRLTEVEELFLRAKRLAKRQQALALELRIAASLGRLMQSRGRSQEVTELLKPLIARYPVGSRNVDLKQAKTVLNRARLSAQNQLR